MTITLKSTYSAPRWAKVGSFIKDLSYLYDLDCHVEVETGWLRESGRFSVTGEEEDIQAFKERFLHAVEDYG